MKSLIKISSFTAILLLSMTLYSHAEKNKEINKVDLDEVVVTDTKLEGFEKSVISGEKSLEQTYPDTTRLMRMVPGGNININGPLTGQVQYRGMFGPRMNATVDGMYINPGGPNWMDPPIHYIPRSQLDTFEVTRGIAPVSSGIETIGGTVNARRKSGKFTNTDSFAFQTDIETGVRSVDEGLFGGGIISASNNRHRIHFIGSSEYGDDIKFGGGKIRPTQHKRHNYGGGYGIKLDDHVISFDFIRNETGRTGTPALPMDIIFVDTNIIRSEYSGTLGNIMLKGMLYYSNVDHLMDNFSLRPPPEDPDRFRFTEAMSKGIGYSIEASLPLEPALLKFGFDGHLAEHSADILNPNNENFFVKNFNDSERNLYGVYFEIDLPAYERWNFHAGIRYTRVNMDTGDVSLSPMLPPPAQRLAQNFNEQNRSKSDNNIDIVAKVNYLVSENLELQLGAGRKTRSPSYIERYAWLPTQASAGLADGNNYVGDINLAPEVSYEIEGGLSFTFDRAYFFPRAFYRIVDDYIQGTPATDEDVIMVSTASGDPDPLRWTNVEAEFWGFDAEGGFLITKNLTFSGIINFVRAKRRDIDDNLYRIAPLNGSTSLIYTRPQWYLTAQGVYVAEQNKVSETNNETKTSGYAIFNLYGGWSPREFVTLGLGIENIFDKVYRDHLAGFNRVTDSDVGLGERIPGPGRNLFASVRLIF